MGAPKLDLDSATKADIVAGYPGYVDSLKQDGFIDEQCNDVTVLENLGYTREELAKIEPDLPSGFSDTAGEFIDDIEIHKEKVLGYLGEIFTTYGNSMPRVTSSDRYKDIGDLYKYLKDLDSPELAGTLLYMGIGELMKQNIFLPKDLKSIQDIPPSNFASILSQITYLYADPFSQANIYNGDLVPIIDKAESLIVGENGERLDEPTTENVDRLELNLKAIIGSLRSEAPIETAMRHLWKVAEVGGENDMRRLCLELVAQKVGMSMGGPNTLYGRFDNQIKVIERLIPEFEAALSA